MEKQIDAQQKKIAALPPTKANKPKIAEMKRALEELQRDPNYRGALTIVREKEEEERERRRGEREREEEEALSGGIIRKKNPEVAENQAGAKTKSADAAPSVETVVAECAFELDSEVVAVVNSAVEGSSDAQDKLRGGLGNIDYKTDVKHEVATMATATIDKLGMGLKRAALRDGALRTVRALLWNPPAVLPALPTVLGLLEETNLKSEPGNKATDLATQLSRAGPNGKAIPELVLPVLLNHVGAAAGGKWKVKVACLGLVKETLMRMRSLECCPLQLGLMMPQVTTVLRAAVGDARKEVKKASEELLAHIGKEMVETPEIKGLVNDLIGSIVDSANMQRAAEALQKLGNTTFMNTVDAASFSLLFPIVSRAMREREHDAKKKGVQVVGASVTLIASPEFLTPYLPELMPLLQECLVHPSDDVQREAAKAFGQLAAGLPELAEQDIMPFLLETLQSRAVNADVSEVNRRGAAHGLCEVLLKRPDMVHTCLYETILPRILKGETPECKAGALALFHFLPHLGTSQFLPHVVRCLPAVLGGLKADTEIVTKQAKRAMEVLVEEYGPTYPRLLLPHMQDSLFFPGEEAQDLAIQLFFMLCDKIQDAVKFGQDFLSVECLTSAQRHSLLSSIYIARTDPNHNVRRNATLLWKERVQSGPKAKAEILPSLLGYLKGLLNSGEAVRKTAATACLAELRSGGDVNDDTMASVEPLSFLTQGTESASELADKGAKNDEAPQQSRTELLKSRINKLMPTVPLPAPVRKYVEAVVLSCCIEARSAAAAKESLEVELQPITPPKATNSLRHFGLEAVLETAFEGVRDVAGPVDEERPSGDCLVRVENLMLMYGGGHTLLKNTTLELLKGHRYGVVGRNGAGKTTLMSTLASGTVQQIPKWLKTLHVKPEILMEVSDLTAVQFCQRQGVAQGQSTSEDAMHKALADVGFPPEMQTKAVSELSGGWRMKLLIASAMMRECDLLLLDEPTNHLDKASVEWLTSYLCGLTKSTVMVISHDPNFLNNVCTDIIQYSGQRTLEYYEGNFESFRTARNITSEEEAEALLLGQDVEDFKLAAAARDGAAPAGDEDDGGLGLKSGLLDKASKISFPIPGKLQGHSSAKPVLELKNVYFTYEEEGENYQLVDVNCKVGLSSRIGIVGKNGAGKSTLLRLLCGEMPASIGPGGTKPGEVYKHRNLRMAYISQDHMFHLEEFINSSPYVYIQKRYQNGWDEALQQRLINPENEEEAKLRKELALKLGKYGREVKNIVGRTVRGNETLYEVEWMNLEDPKQNTHETVAKLRKMSVAGMARAYDERVAAQAAGIDQRPLSAKEIVKHFEQFGLEEELVMNRQIGTFSAGQRSKLTLAAAFWTKPHLVALDEPTNYIDMETLDSLAKGLNRFKGAVIVISHSGEFVDRVCEETWLVDDKHVTKQGGKKK
eukprot:TRINITY_DN10536_c0_g1_i1.p1 TRINITY_DN10536_c0_g1~~TRINITY_DN10536_c0_g1_i1.p1  ORF type:complete len:1493 (-),score=315.49 TRINITY_DN10536_c0_g1_i1:304-4572(-)